MKSLGIRTLDKRGNVTIPKSFLKVHDIKRVIILNCGLKTTLLLFKNYQLTVAFFAVKPMIYYPLILVENQFAKLVSTCSRRTLKFDFLRLLSSNSVFFPAVLTLYRLSKPYHTRSVSFAKHCI